ncbi:hypothetical protein AGMMS49992_31850 [Clostridia bacterium]|nr:hypothetical protein AGMMS49992_31850 [Clostridia bacterium]
MIVTAVIAAFSIFGTIRARKIYKLKKQQSRLAKQDHNNHLSNHYATNNYQEPTRQEFVKPLETVKHNYATFNPSRVHEDIKGLLWIVGENYTQTLNKRIQIDAAIYPALSVTFSSEIEPSLINMRDKAVIPDDINAIEPPSYYPCYSQLTPTQKGVYWQFLEDPYDPRMDIGYVFILYYGLERHLLLGDYERAFSIILKLRQAHSNRSFHSYSGNALMLTCMYRKRPDLAMGFVDSEDNIYESKLSDNLYLLCKLTLKLPVTAVNIVRLHKSFEFTSTIYIKRYADLFEDNLIDAMEVKYGKDRLYINDIVTTKAKAKTNIKQVNAFANMSIADRTINIPALAENFHLKRDVYELLMTANEATKQEVSSSRKKG